MSGQEFHWALGDGEEARLHLRIQDEGWLKRSASLFFDGTLVAKVDLKVARQQGFHLNLPDGRRVLLTLRRKSFTSEYALGQLIVDGVARLGTDDEAMARLKQSQTMLWLAVATRTLLAVTATLPQEIVLHGLAACGGLIGLLLVRRRLRAGVPFLVLAAVASAVSVFMMDKGMSGLIWAFWVGSAAWTAHKFFLAEEERKTQKPAALLGGINSPVVVPAAQTEQEEQPVRR